MRAPNSLPSFAISMTLCLLFIGIPTAPVKADGCPQLQNAQYKTVVYGDLLVNGQNVSPGSMLLARSPRADIVGCQIIETAGTYGLIYVYGEEIAPNGTTIPGMRGGEKVAFSIDGVTASASPVLFWANDGQDTSHAVALSATFSSPPASVSNPAIEHTGGALNLGWTDVGGTVHHYEVWRSNTPFFTPGEAGSEQVGSDIPTPHVAGAPLQATGLPHSLGNAAQNDYYLIIAVDTVGQTSAVTQRLGAFDFALTPGG